MEEHFFILAETIALAIEAIVVLLLGWASAVAAVGLVRTLPGGPEALKRRRDVWLNFAVAIVLALEFALASDIIRSAIAPTWEALGKLATIAAIRTALNLFLMRDIEGQIRHTE